ncbi:MAG TPA: hypothetical protein VNO22_02865 [Planctomycetota bacterium]|nr:hypothetical protein [Planctomycetota bacterium]
MIRFGYVVARKSLGAGAGSALWAQQELPSKNPVYAFHIDITGTGNDLSDIDRVRVRRNSVVHVDVQMTHLLALIGRFTKRIPATTATRFTIPLYRLTSADQVDAVEFAVGLLPGNLEVEVRTKSTWAAGDMGIAWTFGEDEDIARIVGQPYIMPASMSTVATNQNNQRLVLDPPGVLGALSLPSPTNMKRVQYSVGGRDIVDSSGVGLLESQEILSGGGSDPLVLRFDGEVSGRVEAILDTDASWSATDKELVYWSAA